MDIISSYQIEGSTNGRVLSFDFGDVDFTTALKATNEIDTAIRYSLLLNETDNYSFENVIFKEKDGETNVYILRYEPDVNWLVSNDFEFIESSYTGLLIVRDYYNNIVAEVEFREGYGRLTDNSPLSDGGRYHPPCEDDNSDGGSGSGGGGTGEGGGDTGGGGTGWGGTGAGTGDGGGSGGSSGGDSGGSSGGTSCSWGTSKATGGLWIDCGEGLLFFMRAAGCDGPGDLDGEENGPIGILVDKKSLMTEYWENSKIDDSQLKPCMQNIMTDLKSLTQGVGQTIAKFAGNTPGFNWETKDGSLDGQTGTTSVNYNITTGTVTSTFDSQAWLNATELSWARTILHESIHANVVSVYYTTFSITQRATLLGPDWISALTNGGHDFIANNYLKLIADALEEYGQNKGYYLNRTFYDDMSWAGLQGTPAFNSLSSADKSRILNTIVTELVGKNINGIRSTQKGTSAGC